MIKSKAKPEALKLFMDGSIALAKVEANGIRVDVPYLERAIRKLGKRVIKLEEELKKDKVWGLWQKEYGSEANVGSGQQLAHVIYDILEHPCSKFTLKGKPSTRKADLDTIDLPFIKQRAKLVSLERALNNNLRGLLRETVDGYLHPGFNLHTVSTYRSSSGSEKEVAQSSRSINFQNIPIRDPVIGKIIRRCFIPRDGCVLVEVDFGAMEWQIASCFWRDAGMVEYASDPKKDIHRDMAAEEFLCDISQVSKKMRYIGKNGFVFPTLYGSYYVQCSRNIWNELNGVLMEDGETLVLDWLKKKGIKELGRCDSKQRPVPGTFEYHGKEVEDNFFHRFPVLKDGREKWIRTYREKAGFPLMTGFWVEGLYSNNQLLNIPIQGPAFHCLLWSIIQFQKWIEENRKRSLIVGQIHDCVLADVPLDELQDVLTALEQIMTVKIREEWKWVIVPLKAEVDVVPEKSSWHSKEPWACYDGVWKAKPKKLKK
jgi:DNA polymerase-1